MANGYGSGGCLSGEVESGRRSGMDNRKKKKKMMKEGKEIEEKEKESEGEGLWSGRRAWSATLLLL